MPDSVVTSLARQWAVRFAPRPGDRRERYASFLTARSITLLKLFLNRFLMPVGF